MLMSNYIRHAEHSQAYPFWMAQKNDPLDQTRMGFGLRLKSARENKNFSQADVATRFSVNKATVSAWETGRGDPGVYRLRELARLYDLSADALMWEDSLTPEAMKFAAQFDSLNERQKRTLYAMWMAYINESATDAQVEAGMPITKNTGFEIAQQVRDASELANKPLPYDKRPLTPLDTKPSKATIDRRKPWDGVERRGAK